MLPLAAYADRLSVRPGETIRFQAANATGEPVETRLARVICADANPAGPGIQLVPQAADVTRVEEPEPAPVPQGSYAAAGGLSSGGGGSRGGMTTTSPLRSSSGGGCFCCWLGWMPTARSKASHGSFQGGSGSSSKKVGRSRWSAWRRRDGARKSSGAALASGGRGPRGTRAATG